MKKILLFIGLLGIVSCRPKEVIKKESKMLQVETKYCWHTIEVFRFNYGGHTYISFNGDKEILHDPDCKKCKSEGE